MKNVMNYRILDCEINPREFFIEFSATNQVHLQPKILDVLNYLAQHYPRLVSREELIEQVWNNNFLVGEQALTNAIWSLRQTFRSHFKEVQLIDTVRKAGYRLTEKPEFIANEEPYKTPLATILNLANRWSYGFMFVLIVIGSWYFGWFPQKNDFKQLEVQSVTTEPGTEYFPAISPNGALLAFKWIRQNSPADLYLKDLTQPDLPLKQLTFDEREEGIPVWSQNAEFIYYYKRDEQDNQCIVVKLSLKNLQEEKLLDCLIDRYPQLSVSADNHLAYMAATKDSKFGEIHIADLDNLQAAPQIISCQLFCDARVRDLAFSPDGKKLAVTKRLDDYQEDIFVIELATSKTERLTEGYYDILGIDWHADNRRIIFGAQYSDIRNGFVVDSKTKNIQSLGVKGFSFPEYQAKQKLIYYHDKVEKYKIATLSTNQEVSSGLFPVVYSEFNHRNSDYSESAQSLVFVSNESGHYELWRSTVNGEQRQQLTFLEKEITFPAWSNNGDRIAFLAPNDASVGNSIYWLDIASKKIEKIRSEFELHGRPNWSADDSALVASVMQAESSNLYWFPVERTANVQLLARDALFGQVNADNELYFTRSDKSLWRRGNLPQTENILVLNSEEFGSVFLWELTAKGVYFYSTDAQKFRINFYDFTSKESKPLVELPWLTDDRYGSFSFVESQQQLLLTISEYPQVDIKSLRHPFFAD